MHKLIQLDITYMHAYLYILITYKHKLAHKFIYTHTEIGATHFVRAERPGG